MNSQEKVSQVVYLVVGLQIAVNTQINLYGEADALLVGELEDLIDTLTAEEQDKVSEVFQILETK